MNVREAILAAANHIERHPAVFKFDSIAVPGLTCGSPGCALGWIAAYSGQQVGDLFDTRDIIGCYDTEFYDRMANLTGNRSGWKRDAASCANGLRLYADKYHPAPKQLGIPDSVRAIFTATELVS